MITVIGTVKRERLEADSGSTALEIVEADVCFQRPMEL